MIQYRSFGCSSILLSTKLVLLVMAFFFISPIINTHAQYLEADSVTYEEGARAAERGDYSTAISKWQLIADKNHLPAQFALGLLYQDQLRDLGKAIEWYTRGANGELAEAFLNLASMYSEGEGVSKNQQISMALIEKFKIARFTLGDFFLQGTGVAKNEAAALRLLNISASEGSSAAQLTLGIHYTKLDPVASKKWFLAAAINGNSSAQQVVAIDYLRDGNGYEAEKWFLKGLENNTLGSLFGLAEIYSNRDFLNSDAGKGFDAYIKLAERGSWFAQFKIAQMYFEGVGVPQNYLVAHMWANLAATDEGSGSTSLWLVNVAGMPYEVNSKVSKDDARKLKEEIASKLTMEDLSKAQQLATICRSREFQGCGLPPEK